MSLCALSGLEEEVDDDGDHGGHGGDGDHDDLDDGGGDGDRHTFSLCRILRYLLNTFT